MSQPRSIATDVYVRFSGHGAFGRIYKEAAELIKLAEANREDSSLFRSTLPRISILLHAISLEALANRVIADAEQLAGKELINERSSTKEKWRLIPKVHPRGTGKEFSTRCKQWGPFVALLKWRDEYVHPKVDAPWFARAWKTGQGLWEYDFIRWGEVPKKRRESLNGGKKVVPFGAAGLPSSTYSVGMEDALRVKQIVDGMVQHLDTYLSGHLSQSSLLKEHDEAIASYPDGNTGRFSVKMG